MVRDPRLGRPISQIKWGGPPPDYRQKLVEINNIIFAKGAPLGSEEYFKIREICANVLKEKK